LPGATKTDGYDLGITLAALLERNPIKKRFTSAFIAFRPSRPNFKKFEISETS
jgi:hypothetical protein